MIDLNMLFQDIREYKAIEKELLEKVALGLLTFEEAVKALDNWLLKMGY